MENAAINSNRVDALLAEHRRRTRLDVVRAFRPDRGRLVDLLARVERPHRRNRVQFGQHVGGDEGEHYVGVGLSAVPGYGADEAD